MASTIEIFNSAKIDQAKLTGSQGFYNNLAEITESAKLQEKFISNVDFSDPSNFAKFGSAEEYYKNAINYIANEYPYDASLLEKTKWTNNLNDLEYYLLQEEYPKFKGFVELSGAQYIGSLSPSRDIPDEDTKSIFVNGERYFVNESLNFTDGFTFETWLKLGSITNTPNILTINTVVSSSGGINDVTLLKVFASASNLYISGAVSQTAFNHSITQSEWHHYAFSVNANSCSLYVDGQRKQQIATTTFANTGSSYVFYKAGLIPTTQTSSYTSLGAYVTSSVFKLGSGSLIGFDETRFWNKERSLENIGRYWFTAVNGNDYSDPNNSNLILYYKYNEGWDDINGSICLDYSGFRKDAIIYNYNSYNCRNSGSAIDLSGLVEDIEPQSVMYAPAISYSTGTLQPFYNEKVLSGSTHDELNIHALYKKFPSWILEQEEENETKHLKQVVQIVSSYFDDLYNKIGEISKYKHQQNTDDKNKLYPFYDKILTSTGFDVSELFNNLDIIEKLSSRSESNIFDEDIQKIKNSIFQNIYNNLAYILKSKGTEKSIRSFLRSYGINENLVRINLYPDRTKYVIGDKYTQTTARKKTLTLTGGQNIYLSSSAIATTELDTYFTLETAVIFPKILANSVPLTASVLGYTTHNTQTDLSGSAAKLNGYVTVETDDYGSKFCFYTGSNMTLVTSSALITNLYDNTVWNVAIRMKPSVDTTVGAATNYGYIVDFSAINTYKENSPHITASVNTTPGAGFITPYTRYFIGAKNINFTGSTTYNSNAKYLYCNYWSTYLTDNELIAHNKDILSYGIEQ